MEEEYIYKYSKIYKMVMGIRFYKKVITLTAVGTVLLHQYLHLQNNKKEIETIQ